MPDPAEPTRLILASRSPRRAQLLREAGYPFTQAQPPFHDPPQPADGGPSAQALAVDLARQKALSLHDLAQPGSVILAADTICVGATGQLIGQPSDRDDARDMIRHFADSAHRVVTGIALLPGDGGQPVTFADEATVTLGPLNDAQLQTYLDSDQWHGKAGGYNLFDRQAAGWPIQVQGDPTTVVGLPMRLLVPALSRLGIQPTAPACGSSLNKKTTP